MEQRGQKREVVRKERKGLSISDIMLIGILLAAGAVLRFVVGTVINFGIKPNFIIAMYCLVIILIRPRLREAAIIGILAGAVCQFFPGQPYIGFVSELIGAIVMVLLIKLPIPEGKFSPKPMICTFISTLASGAAFISIMYILYYSGANVKATPLAVFAVIILITAIVNAVIVQVLYVPLKHALKR